MDCEDGKDDSAYVWNSEKLQHDIFHYALERVVYDGVGGHEQVIKPGEQADVYNEAGYRQNYMGLVLFGFPLLDAGPRCAGVSLRMCRHDGFLSWFDLGALLLG